jgi:hypothetical protein
MFRRSRGIARTMGRTALIAGTATAVSGHVAARQQARWAHQADAESVPQQPSQPSVVEELAKLADLKERGFLTDEEFAAQKRRLLGP